MAYTPNQQYAEDAAHVSGDMLNMAGAVRRDSPASGAGADGDNATLNVDANGRLWANALTQGDVAHDAVDSGNPQKIGGIARSSEQAAVANADRVNAAFDLVGKQIVLPYANPENFINGTGNATGTSDTAVIAAQGSGVKIYITTLIINNTSATDTHVNIKDGSTTKLVIPAPQKSGAIITLPTPLALTANTALNFASGASVTTMYVSAVGYKGV